MGQRLELVLLLETGGRTGGAGRSEYQADTEGATSTRILENNLQCGGW
ncbi:MAG: hypothetical protein HW384_303 [Dehalococcoidia bacterium]|nr:hypothetical protein [Dehalococcoidia bacterium]